MTLIRALLLTALLAVSYGASPSNLTEHQQWALEESAKAAQTYDDGRQMEFGFLPTFQAILGQESSYCFDKHNRDPNSWGCGQLKVSTAQLFDKGATAKKLLNNDRYNIWIAATYLRYCRDQTRNWTGMVRCYHGWKSSDWPAYVKAIRDRLQELQPSED